MQDVALNPPARPASSDPALPFGPPVLSLDRIAESAATVAGYARLETPGASLRSAFLRALDRLQRFHLDLHPDEAEVGLSFAPASPVEEEAYGEVMIVDHLPQGWSYGPEEAAARRRVAEGLRIIARLDPALHRAINTIVGTFIMARMAGYEGGSISSVIGVIWIGLPVTRPAVDFADLIVHEYVHQALFLEDMVHCLFLDGEARMGHEDGLVTTTILKIPRGYDKAFHSAFVAAALTELHHRLGDDRRALGFLDPLAVTLSGLQEKNHFLTEHGRIVLDSLIQWVTTSRTVRHLLRSSES
jgi:hypothetical protein